MTKPRKRKARLGLVYTSDCQNPYVVTSDGRDIIYRRKFAKKSVRIPLSEVIDRVRGRCFSFEGDQCFAVPIDLGVEFQHPRFGSTTFSWQHLFELATGQRMLLT